MSKFSANDLTKLEYPSNVIKRPSMYLGNRGSQQTTGVREIIDNSTHERIRGHADRMQVVFSADGSCTVNDNGRGLPVDVNKKTGTNGIIMTVGSLHSGSNFDSNIEKGMAGSGLNGVGSAVVTALSSRFDVKVYKNNRIYTLSFRDGYPGHFKGEGPDATFEPSEKIKSTADKRPASEKKLYPTGTSIRFWFNPDRFPKDEGIDIDDIVDRLQYIAYIVPHFNIEVLDETRQHDNGDDYYWEFYSEDGIEEMIEVIAPDEMYPDTNGTDGEYAKKGVHLIKTEGKYTETVSDENGKVADLDRYVTADVAFRYGTGYEKKLMSFANTIHTQMGGIHEKALEKALVKAFGERLLSMRGLITAKDEPPIADDYFEGMSVAISINVPEPQFVGQQKDKISGPEVEKALTKALTDSFASFANAPANQKIVRPMFQKVVQASKNRQAAADAKLAKRRSNQVTSAAMPPKLADCDITGTDESELLICEGDSAMGTIKKARDATFQAVIPIRGKILNSYNAKLPDIIKNTEVMDIAKAIGAGFGENFDIDKIRYGRIIFASDADIDGLQINNLLYTVFNRVFHQMIVEGRVYQSVPPLYEVTTGTGRNAKTYYGEDDFALQRITNKLDRAKKKYKVERNKGLAEQSPESFSETVLDPATRTLRRITLEDAEKAEDALMLTMGTNSQERKDFMEENFQVAIDTGLVQGFEGEAIAG